MAGMHGRYPPAIYIMACEGLHSLFKCVGDTKQRMRLRDGQRSDFSVALITVLRRGGVPPPPMHRGMRPPGRGMRLRAGPS